MGTTREGLGALVRHAGVLLIYLMVCTPLLQAQTSKATGERVAHPYGAGGHIREMCRSCEITLLTREVISGELYDVTHDSLGIITLRKTGKSAFTGYEYSSFKEMVPLDAVSSIKCGDPLWDGALKGFIAGGIPLALFGAILSNGLREPGYDYDSDPTLEMAGIGLGIGGTAGLLIGLFIDSAIGSREKEIARERLVREWTGY